MPETPPNLDASSNLWLTQAHTASLNSKLCTMPEKYFNVLKTWGYVEGTPAAAKITGKGLSKVVSDKQAEKAIPKKTKKRKN
jgi:hypothetical protein